MENIAHEMWLSVKNKNLLKKWKERKELKLNDEKYRNSRS